MRCKINMKEIMCKAWIKLSKLIVHSPSLKENNLSGRYWTKVCIKKIFQWNNIHSTFSVWNNYNVISKWSKTKWCFVPEKMQVYCNTVPILPLLSFLFSHPNILPLVIVLFGFENQLASWDFIQLVTVLCLLWWIGGQVRTHK
jgi:hypothetical protein